MFSVVDLREFGLFPGPCSTAEMAVDRHFPEDFLRFIIFIMVTRSVLHGPDHGCSKRSAISVKSVVPYNPKYSRAIRALRNNMNFLSELVTAGLYPDLHAGGGIRFGVWKRGGEMSLTPGFSPVWEGLGRAVSTAFQDGIISC